MDQTVINYLSSIETEFRGQVDQLLVSMKGDASTAIQSIGRDIEESMALLASGQMSRDQFQEQLQTIKRKIDNEANIAEIQAKQRLMDFSAKVAELLLKFLMARLGL